MGNREDDLLAALDIVRRRAALQVGLPLDHGGNARAWRDWKVADVQVLKLEFATHCLGDLQTQIDCVAY